MLVMMFLLVRCFFFVDFLEGIRGFVGGVALVLRIVVFSSIFYIGFRCCIYFVFIIFMGWYNCVYFLAEVGRPRLLRFTFGGSYLLLVIFCDDVFGMLLGPAWRVVIVFTGFFFRESRVIVCWPGVCMLFVRWNDHMSFMA